MKYRVEFIPFVFSLGCPQISLFWIFVNLFRRIFLNYAKSEILSVFKWFQSLETWTNQGLVPRYHIISFTSQKPSFLLSFEHFRVYIVSKVFAMVRGFEYMLWHIGNLAVHTFHQFTTNILISLFRRKLSKPQLFKKEFLNLMALLTDSHWPSTTELVK